MKILLYILFFGFIFSVYTCVGQEELDCRSMFDNGTILSYKTPEYSKSVIKIRNDFHIEKFDNSNGYIKAKREWISECKFKLTIVKVKGDNSYLKPGQTTIISILKINGDEILYEYEHEGEFTGQDIFIKLR